MDRYHWLLALHVTGAFLLLGGAVVAGVFNIAALRRERPSEIALLLGLTRWAVVAISAGLLVTIAFGLWLVHNAGYGYVDAWGGSALKLDDIRFPETKQYARDVLKRRDDYASHYKSELGL